MTKAIDFEAPKIAVVKWLDPNSSSRDGGWMDAQETNEQKPSTIVSSGILFKDSDDVLQIVMDWDATDGGVHTLGSIPKSIIQSIKFLKMPKGMWPKGAKGLFLKKTTNIINQPSE